MGTRAAMPNLMQTGAAWLAAQLKAHASKTVTYRRTGETDLEDLAATIGRTEFELVTDDGHVTRFESRDFLVAAADLVLDGSVTVPQRGDRIIETIGDATLTYEVLPNASLPAFKYSDEFRNLVRIHTKLVTEA
jgi:hypothetical protein